MIETFETTREGLLRSKDNGFNYDLCSYRYTNDDESQSLGLDISRGHPGKPNPAQFLYSFSLEFLEDLDEADYEKVRAMKRSFDRKAHKIPGLTEDENGYSLNKPLKLGLSIYWHYTQPSVPESDTSQIGIYVTKDFDKKLETLDRVVATLPYAVKVFNQLSPLPLEQEAIDRTIRIAQESDLIRHRAFRRR